MGGDLGGAVALRQPVDMQPHRHATGAVAAQYNLRGNKTRSVSTQQRIEAAVFWLDIGDIDKEISVPL